MTTLYRGSGNWVSGDRFYNRTHELQHFIELLEEGAHVLLAAQRRVGKTSLMRETGRRIADRFHCVHVDVEGSQNPGEAILEIALATRELPELWALVRKALASTLEEFEEHEVGEDGETALRLRDAMGEDWRALADSLFEAFAASDPPVILFIDELSMLVTRILRPNGNGIEASGIARADLFMSWLRGACIKHKGSVRVVVSGSIGLEPVLHTAGLSGTINVFKPIALEPWSDETAKGCLEALAETYDLVYGEGALDAIVQSLGANVPHHVQMFFDFLYEDAGRREDRTVHASDVERIYQDRMLSSRGHSELRYMTERMKYVLPPEDLLLAEDLLTECAVNDRLDSQAAQRLAWSHDAESPERLRRVLGVLEHDGYIALRGDAYHFTSRLARDWWRARYGFGFIPAAERG